MWYYTIGEINLANKLTAYDIFVPNSNSLLTSQNVYAYFKKLKYSSGDLKTTKPWPNVNVMLAHRRRCSSNMTTANFSQPFVLSVNIRRGNECRVACTAPPSNKHSKFTQWRLNAGSPSATLA